MVVKISQCAKSLRQALLFLLSIFALQRPPAKLLWKRSGAQEKSSSWSASTNKSQNWVAAAVIMVTHGRDIAKWKESCLPKHDLWGQPSFLLPLFGRQKAFLSLSRVRDWQAKRPQKITCGVWSLQSFGLFGTQSNTKKCRFMPSLPGSRHLAVIRLLLSSRRRQAAAAVRPSLPSRHQ